jgi:hypothetical protein
MRWENLENGLFFFMAHLRFDLDLSQFTHIYLASLTWGTAMINRLAVKLVTEAAEQTCRKVDLI